MDKCRKLLEEGIDKLRLSVNQEQIEQLLSFIMLIAKWNKAYNLTSIKNVEEMVRLHLLDSLALLPYVQGKAVADIGTGAGLPGIPLAVCLPEIEFTLLDSNAKKTRFVKQAVLELKLKNVSVVQSRVEAYQPKNLFDSVMTRAFTNLPRMLQVTWHILIPGGQFIAMKGHYPEQELAKVKESKKVFPIEIPGVSAERCVVLINKPEINEGDLNG